MSRTSLSRAALAAATLLTAAACDRAPTSVLAPGIARGTIVPNARNAAARASGALLSRATRPSLNAFNGTGYAIITNGTVQLGVNAEGHLNVPGDVMSTGTNGTTFVGLRYVPTNGEATAPGCLCEGWGVADAAGTLTGSANEARFIFNLEVESFASTASTAISVVILREVIACDTDTDPDCTASGGEGGEGASIAVAGTKLGDPVLRVTHDYHPSPATPNLYEVVVTVENIGPDAVADLRYRRVMDWDIAPNTFSEYVTIGGTAGAANVLHASNDGFESADPHVTPLGFGVLTPISGDFVDHGPEDHGALFEFGFGALGVGESRTFTTFYGAAGTESGASAALSAVGAEIFSFGQPNWDGTGDPFDAFSDPFGTYGASTGEPATFIFAFEGVGGDPLLPPTAHAGGPYPPRNEGSPGSFSDGGSSDPDGSIVAREWDFGDGTPTASGTPVPHTFADNGVYTVTLKVTDDDGLSDTDTRLVTVRNVAPTIYRLKLNSATQNRTRVGESFWAEWYFRDPGVMDHPWAWTITWGDGSADGGATGVQGAAVTTTHTYASAGVKSVTFKVTDKDGGSHSRTIPVIVMP